MISRRTPPGTLLVLARPVDTREKMLATVLPEYHSLVPEDMDGFPFHGDLTEGSIVRLERCGPAHRTVAGFAVQIQGRDDLFPADAFDVLELGGSV